MGESLLMDDVVQKFDANWKNIIIGSVIGLILLFIIPTVLGSIAAIILATIYVGLLLDAIILMVHSTEQLPVLSLQLYRV